MCSHTDKLELARFQEACEEWKKKYASDSESARKILQELGFIDENGELTDNYK